MEVNTVNKIGGEVIIPGDKSISHRAAIISSLTENTVNIKNFLLSRDCLNTLQLLKDTGVEIENSNGNIVVYGKGIKNFHDPSDVLYAGNSGTLIRIACGVLSSANITAVITGDESVNSRPMKRIIEPLREMGAKIFGREDNSRAPIIILPAGKLKGRSFSIPVASAQIKSSILLAGLAADDPTEIIQPEASRDHTERMLEFFGADISYDGKYAKVNPGKRLKGKNLYIPGDLSSALYFIIASLIVPGSRVSMRNIGVNPSRSFVLDILRSMGARIEIENVKSINNEPVADIVSCSSRLHAVKIDRKAIPSIIDEIPALCVASAFAEGETIIEGAEELRHKESDRISSIYSGFLKAGVNIRQNPDGLVICGNPYFKTGEGIYESYGDHRIAMSLAIMGLRSSGNIKITNSACIETSFPDFVYELKKATAS
jgi:3-phosphoshikimate 1-carboxyvinyltransferase